MNTFTCMVAVPFTEVFTSYRLLKAMKHRTNNDRLEI